MTTGSGVPPKRLKTKSTINITIKRKNRTLAIPVAADATPLNPNKPATIATIRKIKAQYNMINSLSFRIISSS